MRGPHSSHNKHSANAMPTSALNALVNSTSQLETLLPQEIKNTRLSDCHLLQRSARRDIICSQLGASLAANAASQAEVNVLRRLSVAPIRVSLKAFCLSEMRSLTTCFSSEMARYCGETCSFWKARDEQHWPAGRNGTDIETELSRTQKNLSGHSGHATAGKASSRRNYRTVARARNPLTLSLGEEIARLRRRLDESARRVTDSGKTHQGKVSELRALDYNKAAFEMTLNQRHWVEQTTGRLRQSSTSTTHHTPGFGPGVRSLEIIDIKETLSLRRGDERETVTFSRQVRREKEGSDLQGDAYNV